MTTLGSGLRGCKGHAELHNLFNLTGRQAAVPACIFSRDCKLRAPHSCHARPARNLSLSVRSSVEDDRSIQSSPSPSLTERLDERVKSVSSSSNRSTEGASECLKENAIFSTSFHASDEGVTDKDSTSTGFHASYGPHCSRMQNKGSVNVSDSQNSAPTGATPSLVDDEVFTKNVANGAVLALGPWSKLPRRYKLILTTSLAFVICNMDKVNLSVAIIPMSNQLHWNASTAGLVQSSFFWGYTLSQIPGGWFSSKFMGEAVLGVGVFIWSVATAVLPLVASFIPPLLFSRLIVGLGEGVSPSAATDLIARNVPPTERSRAVAFVFNGLNVGSVIGLVLAPEIIEHFGWESVFYIFGVLGIFWCIYFKLFLESTNPWEACDIGNHENSTFKQLWTKSFGRVAKQDEKSLPFMEHEKIPWKAFLRSSVVWAMIYTHFCGNWGHYSILAWLPTYFSEELNLSLTNAALISVIPPLGGMLVSSFAAPMADHLISKGVNATFVRKLCQTIAFLSPTIGMTLCSLDLGISPWVTASIITSSLAFSSFALGGLYCSHQDISPKYASILLGITNTAGAIPGILGVYLTGVLLDETHSWRMALFTPCIFFWITGTIVWNLFASSEPQSFEG